MTSSHESRRDEGPYRNARVYQKGKKKSTSKRLDSAKKSEILDFLSRCGRLEYMQEEVLEQIRSIAQVHEEVLLVYLFGSKAKGTSGPLSDYDVAVVTNESDKGKNFNLKLKLSEDIRRVLKTDAVDVVIMNAVDAPELKYAIVSEGIVVFEREAVRVTIEPRVMNEYFDFMALLRRHQLTRA